MNKNLIHFDPPKSASDWVVRLHSDQVTQSDRLQFEEWRAENPANSESYAEHEDLWRAIGALAINSEARAILLQPKSRAFFMRRRALLAGAAAIAAASADLWVLPRFLVKTDVFQSAKGERRNIVLDDGSSLALNTESRVRTRFLRAERCLMLEQGQCFVQVAKNPERPFRVFVGNHEVRALGTAFDVYRNGETTQVTLEEGSVGIYDDVGLSPEVPIYEKLLGPSLGSQEASAILTAGKRATITAAKSIKVEDVDLKHAEAWRHGRLIFDDTSLDMAVRDVNRYVNHPVVLGDPSLAGLKISGVFKTGHLDQFAQTLTESFGLRLEDRDGAIFLYAP